jgi:hypothetical protein
MVEKKIRINRNYYLPSLYNSHNYLIASSLSASEPEEETINEEQKHTHLVLLFTLGF